MHQLQTTREDVKGQARAAVAHARSLRGGRRVLAHGRDAPTSSSPAEVCAIAIDEGATTINIPDTVGYTMPQEFTAYLARCTSSSRACATSSSRCTATTTWAWRSRTRSRACSRGARQVECAINGIGERAGNASLEEIVMLLHTREPSLGPVDGHRHDGDRAHQPPGLPPHRLRGAAQQGDRGRNAFAHESGIHQDGVLKERTTYEIMDATTVGLEANSIVLGKHSGRHALQQALEELGFTVSGQALNQAFKRFKEIADKKKQVTAMDLEALVTDELRDRRGSLHARVVRRRGVLAPPAARDRRRAHARRRGPRARSPATARSTRSSARSTRPPGSTPSCASSAWTRSPAARTRSARPRSCSRSAAVVGSGQGVSTDIIEAAGRAYVARSPTPTAASSEAADALVVAEAHPAATPAPAQRRLLFLMLTTGPVVFVGGVVAAAWGGGAPPAAAPQPPGGWDGTNPFACELQQAGFGATVPHPDADPFCIEFDKRHQNITQLGIVDFLANEPARVAVATPKCWYFQSDHWRASVVQDDASTKTYEWDGHYFFDKATGDGGAWVSNFNVNGKTFDPSSMPGVPSDYARFFGPGTGGVITRNAVKAEPDCVERASARPPYAQPRAGVDPGTGRGCVGAKGIASLTGIGEVRLGDREGTVRTRLGDPHLVRRGFLRWCLTSGGSVRAGVPGDRSGGFGSGDDPVVVVVATSPRTACGASGRARLHALCAARSPEPRHTCAWG